MPLLNTFLEQGYTPQGMPRKVINTDTGQVGLEDNSTLAKLTKGLQTFMIQRQQQQEKLQKELEKETDMYKTLREAGYDSKSAHDAVMKGKFPTVPGEESIKQQQEVATLAHTKAETEKLLNPKLKDRTELEKFRSDIKLVKTGEATWDELTESYPDRIGTIEKLQRQLSPKIEKSATFKAGTGGAISRIGSFFNRDQAELDSKTRKVISNIKTQADFDEFLQDAELYASEGVDIKAIKEYFGRK